MIIAALILIALFLATWWLSVKLDNYSFVDVSWSLAFAPVAVWLAYSGSGWLTRRYAIALLVAAWSLRLGIHLWRRVASHHPKEDVRYAVLRDKWQANPPKAFFWFFLAQAVLVWLLMLPVYLITQQSSLSFHLLEWIGLSLWALALIGEGIADAQLARFKQTNTDPLGICKAGLWCYSRHPNYFFQSLLWWALFLMALPATWGWTAIIAPLAMLHFLLNVTGIPLTEKLSLQKRGDAFRHYQQTTSAFVPWFPKAPRD
jgi:steroid 5-alpha reductase family enzyme